MFDYNKTMIWSTDEMEVPSTAQGGRNMERKWITAAIVELLNRADEAQLRAIFQFISHYLSR